MYDPIRIKVLRIHKTGAYCLSHEAYFTCKNSNFCDKNIQTRICKNRHYPNPSALNLLLGYTWYGFATYLGGGGEGNGGVYCLTELVLWFQFQFLLQKSIGSGFQQQKISKKSLLYSARSNIVSQKVGL
jgi:hypothetical protein